MSGIKNSQGLYKMKFLPNSVGSEHSCGQALVSLDVWHQRLGHFSKKRINEMKRKKQVLGLVINHPNTEINDTNNCAACCKAKMKRRNKTHGRRNPAKEAYGRIHADLHFPSRVTGAFGINCVLSLTDE